MNEDRDFLDDPEFIEQYHELLESGVHHYNETFLEPRGKGLNDEELERTIKILKEIVPYYTPRETMIIQSVLKGVLLFSAFSLMHKEFTEEYKGEIQDPVAMREAFEEMLNLSPSNTAAVKQRLDMSIPINVESVEFDDSLDANEIIRKYGASTN